MPEPRFNNLCEVRSQLFAAGSDKQPHESAGRLFFASASVVLPVTLHICKHCGCVYAEETP